MSLRTLGEGTSTKIFLEIKYVPLLDPQLLDPARALIFEA